MGQQHVPPEAPLGRHHNAACVVSMVDRLVHNAEVIAIEGQSTRLKEATE
ncbi:hypothetical protein [Ensifer oleiphilus]|nr:hypothetical protein [Ensifer oleiphilus]